MVGWGDRFEHGTEILKSNTVDLCLPSTTTMILKDIQTYSRPPQGTVAASLDCSHDYSGQNMLFMHSKSAVAAVLPFCITCGAVRCTKHYYHHHFGTVASLKPHATVFA
jgi:hypothetical protein